MSSPEKPCQKKVDPAGITWYGKKNKYYKKIYRHVFTLKHIVIRTVAKRIKSIHIMTKTSTSFADPPMQDALTFRAPRPEDGPRVTRLIADCPPLDLNSAYCNLLQCTHFAGTCILAERRGEAALLGWISGYLIPESPDKLFIWQVAVAESARGQGLAGNMLKRLLARPSLQGVRYLVTTITPDNDASWAFFRGFAARHGCSIAERPLFEKERHFAGRHETEWELTIGPLSAVRSIPKGEQRHEQT
jgi:L-2,4-diaminobutyric acid acetyltransferase